MATMLGAVGITTHPASSRTAAVKTETSISSPWDYLDLRAVAATIMNFARQKVHDRSVAF
jgi:hypothetical protein